MQNVLCSQLLLCSFIITIVPEMANSQLISLPNLARSCVRGACSVLQSTYLAMPSCNASNADDNSIAVNDYVCTCPGGFLCKDPDPWLRIDLGTPHLIFAGRIWDKQSLSLTTRNYSTLDGFKIWLGNSNPYNATGNSLCFTSSTRQHLIPPYINSFFCSGTGRYVYFQPTAIVGHNTNPSADFAEIQLYPPMTNLARACSAGACSILQSSYYTASPACQASHANDGDYTTFVCTCSGGGYCTDSDPWLRVDLEETRPLFGGIMSNRPGFRRMDNFRIWAGDNGTTYNATGNTLYGQLRSSPTCRSRRPATTAPRCNVPRP